MKTPFRVPLTTATVAAVLLWANTTAALAATNEAIAPSQRLELFNGKDFTGWKLFLPGDADVTKTWSIQNGVIFCTGQPAGYLRTEQSYRDYKLTVEWRFTKPGNTGVLLHMSEPDRLWPKSIEAQGFHENQGDFWAIEGANFKELKGRPDLRLPKKGAANEKPVGEWNRYEIICKADTIRLWVNGRLMNEATECNVTQGKICIQSEGSEIEVRRVSLDPAP